MSHRMVFLDRATIAPQIRVRPPSFAHELIEHAETRANQVAERLAGASIATTNKAPITAATIERLPALKLVAVAAPRHLYLAQTRHYCSAATRASSTSSITLTESRTPDLRRFGCEWLLALRRVHAAAGL